MAEWYASWSGGADSTAQIILNLEYGHPMTAVVYCEIMYSKERSAEIPEHRDFIYETAIPWIEDHGVKVITLRSEKTALEWMMSRAVKGKAVGKIHGFPLSGNQGWCSVKRDCKLPPLNKFRAEHPGANYYEGICYDEPKRIKQDKLMAGAYTLVKHGYTQEMSRALCREVGLLSPIYEFSRRGGCYFCPNASDGELRHLYLHHRDYWDELLEIEANPEIIRPMKFRVDEGLHDIQARFELEEMQITIDDILGGTACDMRCDRCPGCNNLTKQKG